jgi:probable addiction module antidote protein
MVWRVEMISKKDCWRALGDSGVVTMAKTTHFDAAEYLDTSEQQAEYISAALETGDADFVRDAVCTVARARGMGEIARAAGLAHEDIYKVFGESGNPEFGTMLGVLRALGLELSAQPAKPARKRVRKAKAA